MKRIVGVNDRGLRVGEDHQGAKLTNHEVEMIRELHAAGMSYTELSVKFEVSKSLIAQICRFERRADIAVRFKVVHIPG